MPSYYRDPQAPTPNVPRRVGVAAVIEPDGSFLVEHRADDEAGGWAFVGGSLGESESVVDALHSQVRKEIWPVHRPIRDAFLAGAAGAVVE